MWFATKIEYADSNNSEQKKNQNVGPQEYRQKGHGCP
tara:strand:+ start:91 stop:201 length:111 start_codon:yes stop_codon:yes gene_type:complete